MRPFSNASGTTVSMTILPRTWSRMRLQDAGVAFEGDGEDDDVGFARGPTVEGAAHPGVGDAMSHLLGGGDRALLVARADHDDLAGSGEPQRQPLSLGTRAAD